MALAATLPYLNSLECDFAYDDGALILKNRVVDPETSWWTCLGKPYWPAENQSGLYRPVTALTFRLQQGLSGEDPQAFHLLNLLLHLAVCLLILAVLRRLAPSRHVFLLPVVLLFAVHPIHTESVTNVIGRAEMLAALFGLTGYLVWLRGPRTTAGMLVVAASFLLAAASKESSVAWLLVIAAHRIGLLGDGRSYTAQTHGQKHGRTAIPGETLGHALRIDALAGFGIVLYLAARCVVLENLLGLGAVSPVDNPIFDAPALERILTAMVILARGIGLILAPLKLHADYSLAAIPTGSANYLPGAIMILLWFTILVLAFRQRHRHPLAIWSLVLYTSLILPVANLLFPIGTIMAERLLYLPSLGVLIGISGLTMALLERVHLKRLAPLLLIVALAALAWRTWDRNPVWKNDATLFAATVRDQPRSAKAQVNLAALLTHDERWVEAEAHYRQALRIYPKYLNALTGLGHTLLMQGKLPEAEATFDQALADHPRSVEAHVRLGNLLLEAGRPAQAGEHFARARELAPSSADAWIGTASALFLLQRYQESMEAWERATALAPPDLELRPYLAAAYREAGHWAEAERLLGELITAHPLDATHPHELAKLLLRRGDPGPAGLRLARRAVELEPTPDHLETLLRCLLARGDCDAAKAVLSFPEAADMETVRREELDDLIQRTCR